jgi:hypothetical protein
VCLLRYGYSQANLANWSLASIKNKIIILTQLEFGELGKIRDSCIWWAWQVWCYFGKFCESGLDCSTLTKPIIWEKWKMPLASLICSSNERACQEQCDWPMVSVYTSWIERNKKLNFLMEELNNSRLKNRLWSIKRCYLKLLVFRVLQCN